MLDDRVRAAALDVGDEPDTAGVVLVRRIVQTLRGGRVRPFLRKTGCRPFWEGHRILCRHNPWEPRDGVTEKS